MTRRVELGCVGHCIVGSLCRWRRHTQVGLYRISSIGDYYARDGKRDRLGAGADSFFETNVFRTTSEKVAGSEDCGCLEVESWCEIDGMRYATAGEAQTGHERFVRKYQKASKS